MMRWIGGDVIESCIDQVFGVPPAVDLNCGTGEVEHFASRCAHEGPEELETSFRGSKDDQMPITGDSALLKGPTERCHNRMPDVSAHHTDALAETKHEVKIATICHDKTLSNKATPGPSPKLSQPDSGSDQTTTAIATPGGKLTARFRKPLGWSMLEI